jgi:uncharacterized protein (TIGR00725 family)
MGKSIIVGVMGGASATEASWQAAYRLGALIAERGWILLNGGRNVGIMEASAKGAHDAGGITVGISPDETDQQVSPFIRIPILTGMGSARNCINVLSSHIVVACPGGPGTLSEIALALKYRRQVILMACDVGELFGKYVRRGQLIRTETPEETVERIGAYVNIS